MDMEKNFTSSMDREENELLSLGGSEIQKITRSNNPPIKATLLRSPIMRAKGSLERDTMLG
jgi:hypothetical protein